MYSGSMRTTINLEEGVLAVIRATAEREGKTLGEVVGDMARQTLLKETKAAYDDDGFPVLRRKVPGVVVTTEDIRKIRDELGE